MSASNTADFVPASTFVKFRATVIDPEDDPQVWGYLDTKHARVGVSFMRLLRPMLIITIPLKLPADDSLAVSSESYLEFESLCLRNFGATGCEEWHEVSVEPLGEVSLRMLVDSESAEDVDSALARAATFLDEQYELLARTCLSTYETEDAAGL